MSNRAAVRPSASAQIAGMIFALLLIDDVSIVREANPAAEELLGASAARLVGRPILTLLTIGDARVEERLKAGDLRLIARGLKVNSSAGERVLNLTSSPLASYPGWRVLTLSDAGQEGMAENREGGEVSAPAVLAHEIKNPLAAIRGAGQLLERRIDDASKPMARMILNEVDRIAALIDRMQQLGSSSALTIQSCNLHEIIRNALATVAVAHPGDAAFVEEFDPSLPPVDVDRGAMEQVLINLLGNACDASEVAEDKRVLIRTRYVSGLIYSAMRLGASVRLPIEVSIIDHGPGIARDLRDHVFEPFVSGKRNGQGLGLALVRKLVRDMGGRIGHERNEREGATYFRINLPVSAVAGGKA